MEREIMRIAPLQTGIILGILGFVYAVAIAIPLFLAVLADRFAGNMGDVAAIALVLFVYPLFGFVGGIVTAGVYNVIARKVGGIRISVE